MPLKFVVRPNHLRDDGTFMPRLISQPILRFEDVLQEMQESTTLRAHDAGLATNNHEIEFCFRPNRDLAAGN